jgi:hypothetical protein
MVFDTLKKVFKFNSKSRMEQIEKRRVSSLNEEIDEYEKEIQEYLSYSSSRKEEPAPQPPAPAMPQNLSQSGALATTPPAAQPAVQEPMPAQQTPASAASPAQQPAAPAEQPVEQAPVQDPSPKPQSESSEKPAEDQPENSEGQA